MIQSVVQETAPATRPAATGLSVIIPAYNEHESIGPTLDRLLNTLRTLDEPSEVLVVDDGSSDGTADIAGERNVVVVRHPSNRGYGAALKTGLRRARHPLVAIADADGTYPVEAIPALLAHMQDCDMAVGARTGESVHIPWLRRPAKAFFNWLASYVSGCQIPDLNSGLRVFWRDTALKFSDLCPSGFSFTSTITLAMLSNHYVVQFVPIDYATRIGSSKIRPVHDTANFAQLIFRTVMYFAPLKIFLPIAGLLMLAGVLIGLWSHIVVGQLMDVTTVVFFLAGLQVAIAGLLADLIDKRVPRP